VLVGKGFCDCMVAPTFRKWEALCVIKLTVWKSDILGSVHRGMNQ